jgi:hypothetical protein
MASLGRLAPGFHWQVLAEVADTLMLACSAASWSISKSSLVIIIFLCFEKNETNSSSMAFDMKSIFS